MTVQYNLFKNLVKGYLALAKSKKLEVNQKWKTTQNQQKTGY